MYQEICQLPKASCSGSSFNRICGVSHTTNADEISHKGKEDKIIQFIRPRLDFTVLLRKNQEFDDLLLYSNTRNEVSIKLNRSDDTIFYAP
jgi:hypothetical protein